MTCLWTCLLTRHDASGERGLDLNDGPHELPSRTVRNRGNVESDAPWLSPLLDEVTANRRRFGAWAGLGARRDGLPRRSDASGVRDHPGKPSVVRARRGSCRLPLPTASRELRGGLRREASRCPGVRSTTRDDRREPWRVLAGDLRSGRGLGANPRPVRLEERADGPARGRLARPSRG